MNKKSFTLFVIFLVLLALFTIQLLYIAVTKSMSPEESEKKNLFVSLSGLPDLAFASQSSYIRHRSLSDLFSIYKDDGSLREYERATYAISYKKERE